MKTVKNALGVLDLFLDHGSELTLNEMSQLSGLNKVTVRRISLTLMECGYLRQTEKRGKYSLGIKLLDFNRAFKRNLWIINIAHPYLVDLSQKANESVILVYWDGTKAIHCDAVKVDHLLTAVPDEPTVLSMHNTSLGKAILAEMTPEELGRYFNKGLERRTPNTITELNDLRNHLAIVKQEGVGFDDEEFDLGVRAIGAAIKSGGGNVVGAVSIIGPSVRLTRAKLRDYVPLVKDCAMAISSELGYGKS